MNIPTDPHGVADDAGAGPPSKSQRKREMLELQELGERLARLPRERIDLLDVPDTLRRALREASRLSSFEGRRRHAQYIGKLMRQVDAEPLRQALLDATGDSRAEVARLHQLEDLRERLLADDQALTQWLHEHPGAPVQALRQAIRAARAERAAGKPPRHYRALYRQLKELLQGTDDEHPATDTE